MKSDNGAGQEASPVESATESTDGAAPTSTEEAAPTSTEEAAGEATGSEPEQSDQASTDASTDASTTSWDEQDAARKRAAEQVARHDRTDPDWVLPVRSWSYHLTGRFKDSGDNWKSYHHGLDFAAPYGTPIRAVHKGRIIAAGWSGAYGKRIKVKHSDGTVTLYGHMASFERTSGKVRAGTIIGYVGATGNVTGPHVHLEVRPDGGGLSDAIDPMDWLQDKGLDP
ncbi:M23 family metallopeptidase [Actinopolymorpha alba]|uniref:M23 family metallopeptidase n=1 Tax=Actinopolymorpha alba TaxID=533267 RepID=UPI00035DBFBA|nr:M23 family metallopeptidase [Actinopolymorpha alba]